ncbi:MAG: hypothetical protein FKY71_09950 [Spiribacter salinus]|uniref:Uncharacterized protein n=1 Tax=Spiribacter salinus TaxID=1335746 RepID=A0A540VR05_9GAMM|nr:MAG: hypothetical protein FKY71_09950 [Spiribacter salinus]
MTERGDNQGIRPEERDAITSLRQRGFAVVVFTPTEIPGSDPRDRAALEDSLVAAANEHIAMLAEYYDD